MIQVEGIRQVEANIEALKKRLGAEMVKAGYAAAEMVRGEAIRSIQTVSHGRVVTRTRASGKEYEHIASAPGDAPNTDTGRLVQSVKTEVKPNAIYVGSTLEYAGTLEFGSRTMSARPWLFPALEKSRPKIKTIYTDHIDKLKVDV